MGGNKVSSPGGPDGTVTVDRILLKDRGKYGPVFILRLFEFLKALPSDSDEDAEIVYSACEAILQKHVGEDGTVSRHSGGGGFFVFRFGHIGDLDAGRRARTAVIEIGRKLLGDRFVSSDHSANNDWRSRSGSGNDQPAKNSEKLTVRRDADQSVRDGYFSNDTTLDFGSEQKRRTIGGSG